MHRILMAGGLVAAAIAATAGLAGAQSAPAQLALVAVEQGCKGVDVGRHGDSLGDETYCRATLRQAGAAAGHAHWDCVYLGTEPRGEDCTAHADLAGGTLQMAGVLSHTSTKSTWAVTGGTGVYAGARGTAAVEQLSATRTAVRIALTP
jgi:hypothetical protein